MPFSVLKRAGSLLLFLSFFLGMSLFSSPQADAACSWTKYAYVNTSTGTDYGTGTCWGTSSGTAYKTIQAALDARNAKYSGTEVTIYFKGNTSQTLNNGGSTNDVYLRPWTLGGSTSALVTIKGDNNIRVESFTFTGSGGVKVDGQNDYVSIENNTFSGASARVEVTNSGQVNIVDNSFSSAYVYAHDSKNLVALDLNTFTGSASKSVSGANWHVVAQNLTGGFYFLGSEVTSTSGSVLYTYEVDGANIMDNTVDGAGTTATAFFLNRTDGSYLTGNELTDVRYGIRLLGDRFNSYTHVNDNTITLVDSATIEAVGLDVQLYSSIDEVLSNVISGGDYAMKFYPAVVDLVQYNTLASSVADIYVENSVVTQILTNILTSSGTNIHFVNSTFSEIAQNATWSTVYGMIFESKKGSVTASYQESPNSDPSGTTVVTQGDIHDNDFYKSDLAIGLYNYTVDEIYSNKLREVQDGVYAYFANARSFRENMVQHVGTSVLNKGVYLYQSTFENFKRNSVADFDYGLVLENGSDIPAGFIRNAFSKGDIGIYVEDANITAHMKNNSFTSSEYALYTIGTGLNGLVFSNNTLYGQNNHPLYLSGTFTSPSTLVNNVFAEFNTALPLYVVDLASLSLLDSNLYNVTMGSPLLVDATATAYTLADLQARGLELRGYEESVNTLVNPTAGDLHLMGWSLAVNSADGAFSPTMDMDGALRPVCGNSDRGAYEASGSGVGANTDADGDGLCAFQESAWSTSPSQVDTDADGLTDDEEIYVYRTAPTVDDSDGDSYSDGEEVTAGTDPLDASSHGNDGDHDGMDDTWENDHGLDPTDSSDASDDADADGLMNLDEYNAGTDPNDSDTDADGLMDGEEASYGADPLLDDSDADGFEDGMEVDYGSDPADSSSTPSTLDTDADGLSDLDEGIYGTDPSNADTDSDGLEDGDELLVYYSDPFVTDTDADGLLDGEEVASYGSDPTSTDSDSDGLSDGDEVAGTYGYVTDPADSDTDGDTFTDYEEIFAGSDPTDVSSTPDTTDTDGDGLYDVIETSIGTDVSDSDTDNDGLSDGVEVLTYGSDPLSTDSDSDGLSDGDEVAGTYGYVTDPADDDSDADGLDDYEEIMSYGTDPNDRDTDADGLPDAIEIRSYGTDPLNADTDADTLSDRDEVFVYFTDPNAQDTDADTLNDGDEVMVYSTDPNSADTDSDGLTDYEEIMSYGTDPNDRDTDADGLQDADEILTYGTDALVTDTDSDGLTDYEEIMTYFTDALEVDTDADTLADGDEVLSYGSSPLLADTDSDGLTDAEELAYGTDPSVSDTDGDSYSDDTEITLGTNPLDASDYPVITDTDGDGLLDTDELAGTYGYVTDPYDTDSDDDTLSDWDELFTYGTNPTSNDTDGDLFTDAYELSESADANSATSVPTLTVELVGDFMIAGYGTSSTWARSNIYYYTTQTVELGADTLYSLVEYTQYGVLGVKWDESEYLGTLTVENCGYATSSFDPTSYTCASIPGYSTVSSPETYTTHVDDVSQIEHWGTYFGSYYTYADWEWYRPVTASSSVTSYLGFSIHF